MYIHTFQMINSYQNKILIMQLTLYYIISSPESQLDNSHDKSASLFFYSIMEMAKGILEATFTHSKNLACFVFVYKTLTNLMAWFETHEKQYQSFIAAFIGGYFVFGKYNKVNEQVCKEMHMIFKDLLFQIFLPLNALYMVMQIQTYFTKVILLPFFW